MEILCFATRCSITSIIALSMCHIVPLAYCATAKRNDYGYVCLTSPDLVRFSGIFSGEDIQCKTRYFKTLKCF